MLSYEWQQLLLLVHRCIIGQPRNRWSSPSVLFLDARIESGPKDGRQRNRKSPARACFRAASSLYRAKLKLGSYMYQKVLSLGELVSNELDEEGAVSPV